MASYGLKYWWQKDRDGVTVRLEIQQRGYSGTAKEIYALQSLSLELQGGDDAIDSPIIKTSLNVGLVDASDMPDTSTVKYGDWTEFFTPDSTLYRFVLKQGGTTRWTGYLTPDSYEEDLTYRSTIMLIARDNIGHLQDFQYKDGDFDREMISFNDIIMKAEELVDFPMSLNKAFMMNITDADGNDIDGNIHSLAFNVRSFENKNWYEILESVLDSLGMVMRYIDDGRYMIHHLRYLPLLGKTTDTSPTVKEVQFINTSGHRMMSPATRQITEVFTYDKISMFATELDSSDDFEAKTITIMGETISSYDVKKVGSWRSSSDNIGCLNNYYHTVRVGRTSSRNLSDPDVLYVSAYTSTEPWNTHSFFISRVVNRGTSINISFHISSLLLSPSSNGGSLCIEYAATTVIVHYSIMLNTSDDILYYNNEGQWGGSEYIFSARVNGIPVSGREDRGIGNLDVSHDFSSPDKGYIYFHVHGFEFSVTLPSEQRPEDLVKRGIYSGLEGFSMEQTNVGEYSERKTTTIYDESYNVDISRSPAYGQVPAVALPSSFINGMYSNSGDCPPVIGWSWKDREQEGSMPLAMIVHKQILMYHSRASNILTGTLKDVTAGDPRFDNIYTWRGIDFLLTGGSLDMLAGYINNATLRDFARYEDMWLIIDTLKFDRDSVNVPSTGGVITVGVIANVTWGANAYLDGEMVSVTPASGSGNATLSVTIPVNESASVKEGIIRLASSAVGVDIVTCDIHQAAAALVFNVSPLSLQLDDLGSQQEVTVQTNDENWTASADVEWLDLIPVRTDGILRVSADLNNGRDSVERSGDITVSAGNSTVTVHVVQAGADVPTMIAYQETYDIGAEGGVVDMAFLSNGEKVTVMLFGSVSYSRAELYLDMNGEQTLLKELDSPPAVGYLVEEYAIPGDPGASGLYGLWMRLWCEANDYEDEIKCLVTAKAFTGAQSSDPAQSTIIQAKKIPALKAEPASVLLRWNGSTLDNLNGRVTVTAASEWSYSVPDDSAWLHVNRAGDSLTISADVNGGRESAIRTAVITITSGQDSATVSVIQGIDHTILNVDPVELPAGQESTLMIGSNAQSLKFDFSSIPDTEVIIAVVDNGDVILNEMFTGVKEYAIPDDPGTERLYAVMLQFTPPADSTGKSVTVTYRVNGEDKKIEDITIV